MGKVRRDNRLNPQETEIAAEPIESGTLSYDEAVKRFMNDAKRRELREDTLK